MEMLANATVEFVLQSINVANEHFIRLKLTQCYMSIISQLK